MRERTKMNSWCVPVKTVPYLTTYEFVKVIGIRATQLQYGAQTAIPYQEYGLDPEDVLGRARQELALRKIHVLLRRPLSCLHDCTDVEFVTLNALSFENVPGIDDEYIDPLPPPTDTLALPKTTYIVGELCEEKTTKLHDASFQKTIWVYPPEQSPERFVRFVTTVVRNVNSTVMRLPDPLVSGIESHALVIQVLSFEQSSETNKFEVDGACVVPFRVHAKVFFVRPFKVLETLATCTIRHVFLNKETDLNGYATALRTLANNAGALAIASLDVHELCTATVHVIVTFPVDKYKTKVDMATHEMYIQKTVAMHTTRIVKNSKVRIRIDSVFTYKDVERAWDDSLTLACSGSFVEQVDV